MQMPNALLGVFAAIAHHTEAVFQPGLSGHFRDNHHQMGDYTGVFGGDIGGALYMRLWYGQQMYRRSGRYVVEYKRQIVLINLF